MEWLEDFFDKTGSVLKALPELFTIVGEETRNLGINVADAVCDSTRARPGSVVICKLACGLCEHSGIYIGNNRIVELNGDGTVQALSIYQFQTASLLRTGFSAYVACDASGNALASREVILRACHMLGRKSLYRLWQNNCHCFTAACLTGNWANNISFCTMLEDTIREKYDKPVIDWKRI